MKIRNTLTIAALSLAGLGASALVVASAVDLGVEANNQLGAGVSVTETCQPAGAANDIAVGFAAPVYAAASQSFTVNAVSLSNIAAACNGLNVQIVVADEDGASLGTYSGTVAGTSLNASLGGTVDSEAVASVNVVIYDN